MNSFLSISPTRANIEFTWYGEKSYGYRENISIILKTKNPDGLKTMPTGTALETLGEKLTKTEKQQLLRLLQPLVSTLEQ